MVVLADIMVETFLGGRGAGHHVARERVPSPLHTAGPREVGVPQESAPKEGQGALVPGSRLPKLSPGSSNQIKTTGKAPCQLLGREEKSSPAG